MLEKNKYVKELENSRGLKDTLFRNTALKKLTGKWLHAESDRFWKQEEITLHCSSKLVPLIEAV